MPPKKAKGGDRDAYRARLAEAARGEALQAYYNTSAGQHDELTDTKRDKHGNPAGNSADLGKENAFSEFKVLLGNFIPSVNLSLPVNALKAKGFQVHEAKSEGEFIKELGWCDVAGFISGTTKIKKDLTGSKEFYPAWKNATKKQFVDACTAAREAGKGFWVWSDNDPLFEQANAVLESWFGFKVEGDTPGGKVLELGANREGDLKHGEFRRHTITSGIVKLYEGVTISHPPKQGDAVYEDLEVLAVSTDGWPCSLFRDNTGEQDETGRVLLDCGFTKLYCSWDDAGTARYVVNGFVWLLALEHKELRRSQDGGSTGSGSSGAAGKPPVADQHKFLDVAKAKDFEEVRRLVESSPRIVNVQPCGRWSALHQAAESGDDKAVRFLLARGADVAAKSSDGKTPKDVASAKVAALLVAPPAAEQHAFLDVAKAKDFKRVRDMTEKRPALVNAQPCGRWSALHQAAESGDVATVKSLLAVGADADARAGDGKTPKDVADATVAALLAGAPPAKKARSS